MISFQLDLRLSTLCVEATGAVLLWYIVSSIVAWHRLRHIPGDFLASFSYLWLARVARSGRQHDVYQNLPARYKSSLIRIGPNDLVTDDPDIIRMMSGAKSTYLRGEANTGNRWNPYHDTMFIMLNTDDHDKMKAKVASAYSGRDTPGVESNVDDQIRSLIDIIRRKYISRDNDYRQVPFGLLAGLFTLDVISKVSLGDEFGCLRNDADIHGFYSALKVHVPFMSFTMNVPWARRIFYSDLMLKLMGPKETDPDGMGKLMKLTNHVVKERFAPKAPANRDMLGSFIRHGLTQQDCESEALFMFIAGSDTTAAVIRMTMLGILSNPRVYVRLKDEIKTAIQDGKASSPITNAESKSLPYLQAVIYEGLRMRPVVPGPLFKEVPAGGDTIDGKFIPAGTAIGTNLSAFLRSKAAFGEDAEIFRPERNLDLDAASLTEARRNIELQFGYGRWMCAGKPLAQMELNKVFFELLRNFEFQLVRPQSPMKSRSYTLWLDEGLDVRVTEADNMSGC